uniref:Uncharacterized protein n=1 Tax=Coturnix japonica TaxID=93934 RepID=A0A8C2T8C7_COTJA
MKKTLCLVDVPGGTDLILGLMDHRAELQGSAGSRGMRRASTAPRRAASSPHCSGRNDVSKAAHLHAELNSKAGGCGPAALQAPGGSGYKAPAPNEHPLSEHPPNEHPLNEHPPLEHPLSEHPLNEHPPNEHPLNEHPPNEHPLSEHPPNEHPPLVHPPSTRNRSAAFHSGMDSTYLPQRCHSPGHHCLRLFSPCTKKRQGMLTCCKNTWWYGQGRISFNTQWPY